jgi:hypothetical protein
MTLAHRLARLVLVEQLYRAMTILRGAVPQVNRADQRGTIAEAAATSAASRRRGSRGAN